MKDVFISYKTEEFDEANWVKTTLETNGISCWMAPMCIAGGSSYAVAIPQAIRECKVFVLILSEKSQKSKWVPKELDQAINEGKTVLPFMLENCPLKDDFNFYLTNVQRYAAYESKTVAMQKMVREIRAILGIPDVIPEEKPAPAAEEKKVPEAPKVSQASPETKPEAPKVQTESEKKPDKKENISKETSAKKKTNPKPLFIAGGVVLAVILLVVGVFALPGLGGGDTTPSATATKKATATDNAGKDKDDQGSSLFKSVTIAGETFEWDSSYISLDGKTITEQDIEKLKDFKELNSIYLTECSLPSTDISALGKAVDYTLSLDNCGLTNEHINSLDFANMKIDSLVLDNNPEITDLNGVAALAETLTELSFNQAQVTDLSFLKDFTHLGVLCADNNGISDISALANCTELYRLSLSNNKISSLEALSACKKLDEIHVSGNELSSLTGLEICISLRKIYADHNKLQDLKGLDNTTLLAMVDLSYNEISDISILKKSEKQLRQVALQNNKIKDISALDNSTLITGLTVDNNAITSLDAISAMTELITLSASNNEIADISGISNCTKLNSVDLSGNKISSTEAITFSGDAIVGVWLDLSDNEISQLVLPSVNYWSVALYGNTISDLSTICSANGSDVIFDYHENIDFSALGASESKFLTYYILDCPLDKQIEVGDLLGYRAFFTTRDEYLAAQEATP